MHICVFHNKVKIVLHAHFDNFEVCRYVFVSLQMPSKPSEKVRVSCLVVNSITVCSYGGVSGLRLTFEGTDVKLSSVGWCLMFDIGWANRGST